MSKYYTRSGDDGFTTLLGKGKVPKYHPRPEALGAVDEVSAALGFARAVIDDHSLKAILAQIQRDLYRLMAELAATPENAEKFHSISEQQVKWLENQIDYYAEQFPPIEEFILSGDTLANAALDLARTAARRAERKVSALSIYGEINNEYVLAYLNRVSSLCFVLELYVMYFDQKTIPSLAKKGE
jgi:cob(I)alamin adenosyltransferase